MSDISSQPNSRNRVIGLALSALGIVYGDIGTSPLYALRECFSGEHALAASETNILGVLSLIFWALIAIISVKYMAFVLRADNRGEGGVLSLTALAVPSRLRHHHWILFGLGMMGASFLYGESVLTPAVSVLSAIEGLKVATPAFEPYVVPLAVFIIVLLFLQQKFGTGRIGAVFGPIILLWFLALAALGLRGIWMYPAVLKAVFPWHAYQMFSADGSTAFIVLGAVFLVVTGGEALYADMGHFGKKPIRLAWFTVVLPALLINYFGQGALLLMDSSAAENPFFRLAPQSMVIPLVVLAAMAAVIASQALISGVFSLTKQGIQLGLIPRLEVIHTSSREIGQIYLPQINYALMVGTLWLVLTFKSSSSLAAAYGISVSGTMVITTVLTYVVSRRQWKWTAALSSAVCGFFLLIDGTFLAANALKIKEGGWIPLAIGAVMLLLMTTWREGRKILASRMREKAPPLEGFLENMRTQNVHKVPGVAMFMVGDSQTTPPAMVHNLKHNKVLHEKVIILTIITEEFPNVPLNKRLVIEKVSERFYKVEAHYGFMETPDVLELTRLLRAEGLQFEDREVTFFVGRETLIPSETPGMSIWREHLFAFMSRNAYRATQYFNVPADQVIEVGMQVEL